MATLIHTLADDGTETIVRVRPRYQIETETWLASQGRTLQDATLMGGARIAYLDYRRGGGTLPWDTWLDTLTDIWVETVENPTNTPASTAGTGTASA